MKELLIGTLILFNAVWLLVVPLYLLLRKDY